MSKSTATTKKVEIDKIGLSISLVVVSIIIAYVLIDPVGGKDMFVQVRDFLNAQLGSFILWMGVACVLICGYLAVSKYGNIKLGKGKVKYKTFTWCAMMFCACMGCSLQFWSVIEWSYYYQSSPLNVATPLTARAAEVGLGYALFHWGVTPWAFYAIGTIAMAYMYYNRNSGGLNCSNICEGVIGKKGVQGAPGRAIDTVFNICIVLGLACTFGTGTYMLSAGWADILGIQNTVTVSIVVILSVAVVFVLTSYVGLDKGMAKLADINTYYAIFFAVLMFILGPAAFILNSTTNSIGFVISNFFEMSLWTDPIAKSMFPESWTMFYWSFWIGTAPFFWVFTAKISEGRRIKEVIKWMMIAGLSGTLLYFGVFSNLAISYQLDGTFDMVLAVATVGGDAAISQFLRNLPGGMFSLVSWTIVGTMFLATSMDSGGFALAANTQKGLKMGDEPSKFLRLFWCLVLTALPIGFIMSGAPIDAFKASANIAGIPILLVLTFAIITLFKYLNQDHGKKTAGEIQKEFQD